MSKNEIIAVTGMTGAGKDYLVERANQEYGIRTVNWGSLIGEVLNTDRDLMAQTHTAEQIEAVQFAVCRKIVDMQPVIVTCHTIRPSNGCYSYNLEIEQHFDPIGYVFVYAPPEVIVNRIKERNSRGERRSIEISVDEISRIQQIKLLAMYSLAEIMKCHFVALSNKIKYFFFGEIDLSIGN